MAPSLASASPRVTGHRDHVVKTLLHGMTGPLDGERYEEVMVPMGSNQDQWIADVASFVRNSFGNSSALVTAADVARVRAATANRKTPWTVEELTASLPALLPAETTLEGDGQSQHRDRAASAHVRALVERRATGRRHVAPS